MKDKRFRGLYKQMGEAYKTNPQDYERTCFKILHEALQKHQTKMVLFIDNLGELFQNFDKQENQRLREILLTYRDVRIVGGTSVIFEAYFDYTHPFYEFFKVVSLKELDSQETRELMRSLARIEGKTDEIERIIKHASARLETLRVLTGGVTRTLILLFDILIQDHEGSALTDLELILDEVTTLYKHRLDDLTPAQRAVVDKIAFAWDAISDTELSELMRIDLSQIAQTLKELEQYRIIHKVALPTEQHLYLLQERFFNIWYLMRLGRAEAKQKVIWLVRFMEAWFANSEQLHERIDSHLHSLRSGKMNPRSAVLYYEAFSQVRLLDARKEHELKNATVELLQMKQPDLIEGLSLSDGEIFRLCIEMYREYEKTVNKTLLNQMLEILSEVKHDKGGRNLFMGITYEISEEYQKARKCYHIAIEAFGEDNIQSKIDVIFKLAYLYHVEFEDYVEAEKYYLMAIDYDKKEAIFNLAYLYDVEFKKYAEAEKYYLMAIEYGAKEAILNLAYLYDFKFKKYAEAEKYYLMAIEYGEKEAIFNLAYLYDRELKKYAEAEKYYLMAIEHSEKEAIYNLAILYDFEYNDFEKAEQYYKIAIENGEALAMRNLTALIFYDFKDKTRITEAISLVQRSLAMQEDTLSQQLLCFLYIWNKQYQEAENNIAVLLAKEDFLEKHLDSLEEYLKMLLAHQQYDYVKAHFAWEAGELKERLKPLYYAYLHLAGEADYYKMPPEIGEIVNGLLEEIAQLAIDYA
jgi:tetratricopeptide (TPR) repeat protein